MGNKVAGTVTFTIDGAAQAVRGNLEVMPATVKREMIPGQSGVQGWIETPVAPSIKCDLTTIGSLKYSDLEAVTDATIVAELNNGLNYMLSGGGFLSGTTINAAEGRIACEFGGMSLEEY